MKNQDKKRIKINYKRIVLAVIFLILIILIVIFGIKSVKKEKNNEIVLDTSESGNIQVNEMIDKIVAEYDGNPYNVPESFTTTFNDYVGENGQELSEDEVENIKSVILSSFKNYSSEKLGINIDAKDVRTIFNSGTIKIADKQCLVFNAYEEVDGKLTYICKFAMSIDGETLYKFDDELFVYRIIEK